MPGAVCQNLARHATARPMPRRPAPPGYSRSSGTPRRTRRRRSDEREAATGVVAFGDQVGQQPVADFATERVAGQREERLGQRRAGPRAPHLAWGTLRVLGTPTEDSNRTAPSNSPGLLAHRFGERAASSQGLRGEHIRVVMFRRTSPTSTPRRTRAAERADERLDVQSCARRVARAMWGQRARNPRRAAVKRSDSPSSATSALASACPSAFFPMTAMTSAAIAPASHGAAPGVAEQVVDRHSVRSRAPGVRRLGREGLEFLVERPRPRRCRARSRARRTQAPSPRSPARRVPQLRPRLRCAGCAAATTGSAWEGCPRRLGAKSRRRLAASATNAHSTSGDGAQYRERTPGRGASPRREDRRVHLARRCCLPMTSAQPAMRSNWASAWWVCSTRLPASRTGEQEVRACGPARAASSGMAAVGPRDDRRRLLVDEGLSGASPATRG